ncbi:MAG: DMT family transporter, partial [Ramlibacter sp.]
TLLAWLWMDKRPGRVQLAGLGLIAAGIMFIALPAWTGPGGTTWLGDLLFVGAATLWALYTLALRGSGLGAWQSAALVSVWSALGVLPLWGIAFVSGASLLPLAPVGQVLTQAIWQGLVAGVAGLAVFGYAVRHIGPAATTSVGALVPSLVAVGGWLLLDEALDATAWFGVLAVVAGVWLASRAAPAPVDARAALRGA